MTLIFTPLQSYLTANGHPCGPIDGIGGPRTLAALLDWLARRALGERGAGLAAGLAAGMADPAFGLVTPQRLCHFLAQAAHETGGFRYLTELGGPAYCARYDGRADLGNAHPGDGYRYRGRGVFQVTGRANYRAYGAKVGLDLEADPDRAAEPATAVATALRYWADHGLNALADADDLEAVTRRINGGLNGLADRRAYLTRLKTAWRL